LNEFGIGNNLLSHDPKIDNVLDQLLSSFLHNFGVNWNPAAGTVNGFTYDQYTNPATLIFWVVRGIEKFEDFQQFFQYLGQNPIVAFQYLGSLILFDWPLHIIEELPFLPELLAPAALVAAAPLAPLGALAGLAGLAAIPAPPVLPVPVPIAPPTPPLIPALGPTPLAAPAAPATAPAPAPAATASTVASPAPPPAPPAPAGPGFVPPYAIGSPRVGMGSGMSTSASAGAKKKAPEPEIAAAAAAASARGAARARRRQRAGMRAHGNEFMDMNVEVDPDWGGPPAGAAAASTLASDQGAGSLGFTGTARREAPAGAAGLTTLAGDEFGGSPRMPLLPGTWGPDAAGEGDEHK
jgi:PPE-repeat protein